MPLLPLWSLSPALLCTQATNNFVADSFPSRASLTHLVLLKQVGETTGTAQETRGGGQPLRVDKAVGWAGERTEEAIVRMEGLAGGQGKVAIVQAEKAGRVDSWKGDFRS